MEAGVDLHSIAEFEQIKENWQREAGKHLTDRPFVTVCVAQSLDGCITVKKNVRTQLSGPKSHTLTHLLRAWNDAILVGANTVNVDNPRLTVRAINAPHPQRVLLDSKLRVSHQSHLLTDSHKKPWIFAGEKANLKKKSELEGQGCQVFLISEQDGYLSLKDCLSRLFKLGVQHLMVEGGSKVLTSFLQQKLVDYMVVTIAPVMLKRRESVLMHNLNSPFVPYLKTVHSCILDHDLVVFSPVDFTEVDMDPGSLRSNFSREGISGREVECLV